MSDAQFSTSRKALLGSLVGASALAALRSPVGAQDAAVHSNADRVRADLKAGSGTKLVLLGTGGGPVPGRKRGMTGHVILHGNDAYVIDCGMGITDKFAQTGIPFESVRSIFLTHHHPDHNVEYGPLLLIGWIQGMRLSTGAYGPPPLTQMTSDYLRAMRTTIDFWAEDFKMSPLHALQTNEILRAGEVLRDANVTVRAELVVHPPVRPAFAYRFDFADRSIVFSGDTVPLDAVSRLAKGADVLVHEAMYEPALEAYVRDQIARGRPTTVDAFMAHMRADHTPIEDVGRIAQTAGVKTLVISHLTPALESLSDDIWHASAAKTFNGKIIVGHDLMVI